MCIDVSPSRDVTRDTWMQACEDGVTPAVRSVKFYGVVYDRDVLAPTGEVEKASAQV